MRTGTPSILDMFLEGRSIEEALERDINRQNYLAVRDRRRGNFKRSQRRTNRR